MEDNHFSFSSKAYDEDLEKSHNLDVMRAFCTTCYIANILIAYLFRGKNYSEYFSYAIELPFILTTLSYDTYTILQMKKHHVVLTILSFIITEISHNTGNIREGLILQTIVQYY